MDGRGRKSSGAEFSPEEALQTSEGDVPRGAKMHWGGVGVGGVKDSVFSLPAETRSPLSPLLPPPWVTFTCVLYPSRSSHLQVEAELINLGRS